VNNVFTIECKKSRRYTLFIRKPYWAKAYSAFINGKPIAESINSDGFIVMNRVWNNGDRITLNFEAGIYTESMPDNPNRMAFKYGPLVLAANLGDTIPNPVYGIPVLLNENDAAELVQEKDSVATRFTLAKSSLPYEVSLTPFYRQAENYYSVYFDRFTPQEWNTKKLAYEAEKLRQQQVELRTVDVLRVGEMQPERDHQLEASERSYVSEAFGRRGREARKDNYFSFNMKVDESTTTLLCTYLGDDDNRSFDILVDTTVIASVVLKRKTVGEFYDVEYPIPSALIQGKKVIRVTIKATNDKTAGRLFSCRTLRR